MGELYDNPTELEEFENRFDDKINKLEVLAVLLDIIDLSDVYVNILTTCPIS